jgi:hypothetical protein
METLNSLFLHITCYYKTSVNKYAIDYEVNSQFLVQAVAW